MKLHRNEKYFKWGLTAFFVIVASIVVALIFSNFSGFYQSIVDLIAILSPVLYGCLFAYLMNPVMKYVIVCMNRLLAKTKLSETKANGISKTVGVFAAVIVLLAAIYALIALIVPNIIESLEELLSQEKLQTYYDTIAEWVHDTFAGTEIETWFNENSETLLGSFLSWIKGIDLGSLLTDVLNAGVSVVMTVANLLIGIIAAIYILIYKKQLCTQSKKLIVSTLRQDHADYVFRIARRTNRIFSGYVIGKILDAVFVGVVTYIGMLIMDMPFAALIATLVGVTNIIPYFGPFLGGIPSALLLLIESPINALYFVIFIVVLQQIDGNIIENRIMGVKLGISDFWVLVSILLFGGLFGFSGMLLGVPVFAVIYSLISDSVNKRLRKKRLPTDGEAYYTMRCVDDLPVTPERTTSYTTEETTYDRNIDPEDYYDDD